jgi:hypothetical protein
VDEWTEFEPSKLRELFRYAKQEQREKLRQKQIESGARIYKHVTGRCMYGQTDAVGTFETVLESGIMSCGSGDDHTLSSEDRKLVAAHDPANGDLILPDGRYSCRKSPGAIAV